MPNHEVYSFQGWVLVTGASGFVGGHCIRALLNQGFKVAGLQRTHKPISGVPDTDTDNFRRVLGDLAGDIECDLPVTAIVHLAAQVVFPGITAAQFAVGNVLPTIGMFTLADRLSVRTVICHSSTSVYGRPQKTVWNEAVPPTAPEPYGASKYMCELIARDEVKDRRLIIPRTPGIIGLGANPNWITKLVEQARNKVNLTVYNADAYFNATLHIDDYCRFVVKVLRQNDQAASCEIVNLAADHPIPVWRVAETIRNALAIDLEIIDKGVSGRPATINIDRLRDRFDFRPLSVEDSISRFVRDCSKLYYSAP